MLYRHTIAAGLLVVGFAIFGCGKKPKATPPEPSATENQTERPRTETPPAQPETTPPPAMPSTSPSPSAQLQSAGQMTATEAQNKLDQAIQYIKDKKYDLADSTLRQVEAHQTSLPASLQPRIAQVRDLLNAARTTGGQIPGLPSMNK